MDPFTIMMVAKGTQAVMNHQAQNAAAAAQRAMKYKQDLATKRALRIKAGFARQAISDTDRMRVRNIDIKSGIGISSAVAQMKAHASMKASGLPEGASTDCLLRQAKGSVLNKTTKMLQDLDMKASQLDFRDREIQQGMDMAWLQAQQAIDSTSYAQGPGAMGLAMGLGGAALDAYTFDQKVGSGSGSTGNTGPK